MYDSTVRKRSWSARGEAAQSVAKPELAGRKVLLGDWKDESLNELLSYGQASIVLYCTHLDR